MRLLPCSWPAAWGPDPGLHSNPCTLAPEDHHHHHDLGPAAHQLGVGALPVHPVAAADVEDCAQGAAVLPGHPANTQVVLSANIGSPLLLVILAIGTGNVNFDTF